jgi:hypothetical protein
MWDRLILGSNQWRRNLQKVSPPHPFFQCSFRRHPEYVPRLFCSAGRHGFLPHRAAAALRAIS